MIKYSAFVLLFLFSCVKSESDSTATSNSFQNITENEIQVFNNVNGVRRKLSTVGIGELGDWKEDGMGGFFSLTSYFTFGDSNLNNLAYYLESDDADRISTLKLVLNINNKAEKIEALKKLASVTEKTYQVLDLSIRKELIESILSEHPIVIEDEEFITELILVKSKIDTWTFKITMKK